MNDSGEHRWLKQGSTSSGDVKEIYDDWAGTYEETLANWDYRAPTQAAEMLRVRCPTDAEILDAGCGTGLTGVALRSAGFTGPIDGIDLSPASLVEAVEHNVYRNLRAVDMQTLPLPVGDDAYDALLCVGVLTYIPDGEGLLREFIRAVRLDGQILVTQRDDLYRERDYRAIFDRLADVVADFTVSEPMPYLPDNPDFADAIKVNYATMRVA